MISPRALIGGSSPDSAFSGAEGILAGGTEVAQTSSLPPGEFMNLSSWPLLPAPLLPEPLQQRAALEACLGAVD